MVKQEGEEWRKAGRARWVENEWSRRAQKDTGKEVWRSC